MTEDASLVEALRAAGHSEVADRLRDTSLARSLRDAGHDDVAAALDVKLGTGHQHGETEGRTEAPPDPNGTAAQEQFGRDLLDQMRRQCPDAFSLLDGD